MSIETPSTGETAAAIREWIGDVVREIYRDSQVPYRQERATVESGWHNRGLGWPQTVGEYNSPAKVQIRPDRYEIRLALPPEVPEEFAVNLGSELRRRAEKDQTLGGRVRSANIPESKFEPRRVSDQDFGGDAWELVIPIVIYQLEETAKERR